MQTPPWDHTYHVSHRSFPQKIGVNSTTVRCGVWICVTETRHKAENNGHTENVCMGWFEYKKDFFIYLFEFCYIFKSSSGLIKAPLSSIPDLLTEKKARASWQRPFFAIRNQVSNSEVAQALTSHHAWYNMSAPRAELFIHGHGFSSFLPPSLHHPDLKGRSGRFGWEVAYSPSSLVRKWTLVNAC